MRRHSARPQLETIEGRLVLNATSFLDPTAGIRSLISSLSHAQQTPATPDEVKHPAKAHAGAVAQRHHAPKLVHTGHHHSTTTTQKSTNSFTNFWNNFLHSTGL